MISFKEAQQILDKIDAKKSRHSYYFFLQRFWQTIISDPFIPSPHIKILCDEIQAMVFRIAKFHPNGNPKPREKRLYDLLINIPPGTTKSTTCTVMITPWAWTIDPSLRMIFGTHSGTVSLDLADKSKAILESDEYRRLFPEVELVADAKSHIKNSRLGERYATSTGAGITGIHAHLLGIDDPLNPKQAASEAELKTANDWDRKTISSRKVDKEVTPTVLTMQRLHENDPSGEWMKRKKQLKHICLPAKIADNVSPEELRDIYVNGLLDPMRLNEEVLEEAKSDLGSYGYSGQYAQRPAPEEGGIWQKWFIPVPDHEFPGLDDLTSVGTDWDLAYTEKESNSASAYVTAGLLEHKYYLYDLGYVFLEFPKLVNYMKTRIDPHYIEAKAAGKSAKQTLSSNGIPAIEVEVSGGGDKVARARSVTPFAESNVCYIRESVLDKLYNDDKQGILKFPNGSHNDVADALAQSMTRLLKAPKKTVFNF